MFIIRRRQTDSAQHSGYNGRTRASRRRCARKQHRAVHALRGTTPLGGAQTVQISIRHDSRKCGIRTVSQESSPAVETEDLRLLAERTQQPDRLDHETELPLGQNDDDDLWAQLNEQCTELADDLLKLLESLKVKSDHRGWESLRNQSRLRGRKTTLIPCSNG